MKLTQLIGVFIFSSLVLISSNSGFRYCWNQQQKIMEIKKKTNCSKFISESFIRTCNGEGFDSLNQWQKSCRAMWNLQYIGWSNASDFLVLPQSNEGELVYGTWRSEINNGEIYAVLKK